MKRLVLILSIITPLLPQQAVPVDVVISTGIMQLPFNINSAGLLTFPCNYLNTGEQTIKYLSVEIQAINPVGDLMEPELGTKYGKITGPIYPGQSLQSNNNFSTYYRGNIERLRIRVIEIEFMDGSINDMPTEFKDYAFGPDEQAKKIVTWTIAMTAIALVIGLLL